MKSVAVLLLFIGAAVSHTQMTKLTIKGTDRSDCLRANSNPNGYPYEQSPIMYDDFPTGILSDNYTCGYTPYSQTAAKATCDVTAGDSIIINYYHGGSYTGETKELDNWIAHSHYGPIMVFMASADSGTVKGARWFKIWQQSILSWNIDGSKSEWASAVTLNKNGGKITVTIPSDLKAGKYYIRTELIALHSASQRGGAQPYIRCGELNIVGGGSVLASDIDKAGYSWTIPSNDYANLDHPGILYNVWWNSPNPYPYPGGTKVYAAGAVSPSTPPPPPPAPTPAPVQPPPPPPAPTPAPTPGGTSTTGDSYDGNVIKSGQYLKQGQKLWDTTKSYYARVKADGRLIIADKNKIIHWTSNNADGLNKGTYVLAPQKNGHLIVFQTNVDPWTIYWDAPVTYDADTDFSLRMQPDGNLVFQNSAGKAVWSSSLNIDLGAPQSGQPDQTDSDDPAAVQDPFVTASTSSINGISIMIIAALVALLF